MKKINRLGLLLTLAAAVVGLAACSNSNNETESGTSESVSETKTVINVGAGVTPHSEILESIKERLSEEGYELNIQVFDDFILPNTALAEGDLDVNLYQHEPFLNNFNEEHNTNLVVAGDKKFYFLPLGIYPGKVDSLEELEDGADVSIPNDATNGGRALLLLQDAGLIKLEDGADTTATVGDIVENSKNLNIIELEASQVVRSINDVDVAVINANYVLDAGMSVNDDALLTETADSQAAERYACIAAINENSQNDEAIAALLDALSSEETRTFINETYNGAVIPVF